MPHRALFAPRSGQGVGWVHVRAQEDRAVDAQEQERERRRTVAAGGRREAKWKSPMTGAYFKDFTVEPNDEMRTSIEAEVKRRVDDARRNARATDDSDAERTRGEWRRTHRSWRG